MKQADVILLGFPLMMSMPEDVRKNDLRIYENVIDSEYFFSGHVMITSQSALIQTKYSRMYFLNSLIKVEPQWFWQTSFYPYNTYRYVQGMDFTSKTYFLSHCVQWYPYMI